MPNIDPNQIGNAPKTFCDSSLLGFGREFFVVIFGSGVASTGFAFNPQHFKQLVKSFAVTLEEYEKKYSPIEIKDAPIPSPIRMEDLKEGLKKCPNCHKPLILDTDGKFKGKCSNCGC